MRMFLILPALALLAACGDGKPQPPRPHCVESRTETDLADGVAMYMVTGSKMMGYVASQKTVCLKWSDGRTR